FHAGDDAEFEFKPLAIFIGCMTGRDPGGFKSPLEPFFGTLAQFTRFVERFAVIAGRKPRKYRVVRPRAERTALSTFNRVFQSHTKIAKPFDHFGAAFESMLRGQLAAIAFGDQ